MATREDKNHQALRGKTILITRPREQAHEMTLEIEREGGVAVVIPMIQISDPANWQACDIAIAAIAEYRGMIFTSTNSAERFLHRCEVKGLHPSILNHVEAFAVGESTAATLRKYGIETRCLPDVFSSESIAEMFRQEAVAGKRFLFPRGNLGRREIPDVLRSRGAIVDEVEVYTNVPPSAATYAELDRRFFAGEFDVVVFASPSAVRNFRTAIPPQAFHSMHHPPRVAVIGPTTRAAAEDAGYSISIESARATSADLVDAISDVFMTKRPATIS